MASSLESFSTLGDISSWITKNKDRERTRNQEILISFLNNIAAFHGRQDLKLGSDFRALQTLTPAQRNDLEEISVNWVQPHVRTLAAHFQKGKPILECVPSTTDEQDIQAAKVGDRLLRAEWSRQEMDIQRIENAMWLSATGNGFLHVYIDKNRGPMVGFEDESSPAGEIVTENIDPFKIAFEPNRSNISKCRWVIISQKLPIDEIESKYSESAKSLNRGEVPIGKSKDSESTLIDSYRRVVGLEQNAVQEEDWADIDTVYHLPCSKFPRGLYVIASGGNVLYVGDYPYPFLNSLPILHFREILSPWRMYGETGTTWVLRSQEHYQMLRKMERRYLRRHSSGKWLIPRGVRIRKEKLNDDNEEYIGYDSGSRGLKPEFVPGSNPPTSLYTGMERARDDGNRASGLNEASQGVNPAGVNAGRALLALQEMDATRMGLTIQLAEAEWSRWGKMNLLMAKNFYTEPRKMAISGDALSGAVWFFDRSDLGDTHDVRCVPGSAMPQNKMAKQQTAMEMFQAGIFGQPGSPEATTRVRKVLEFGQAEDVYDDNALDEQVAEKENVAMTNLAMSLVSQGIQDPAQMQQAVMPVGQWDDHALHMKVHLRQWKKPGVRDNPGIMSVIGDHLNQHAQALNPQPQQSTAQPQELVATLPPNGEGKSSSTDQAITQADVNSAERERPMNQ